MVAKIAPMATDMFLGTFDEKSPKTPKFWGGDEGKNLGDFNHTMQESQLLYRPFSSVRAVARISF